VARFRPLAVLAAALAVVLVPAGPAAVAAPTTADPADAAAGWLAGQLLDGSHYGQDFGDGTIYPDAGLTLDAVLAFAAAGSAGSSATAAMTWLASGTNLADYAGDGTSFSDAGRLAKVAYAALVTGGDPADVGGVDVLGRLTAQLTAAGRFSDLPADQDLSNAFGQSFALLALERTPAGAPAAAVAFLAGSECPGGGFPLNYGQPQCTPDTDATAMVVQALAGPAPAAAGRGLAWLAGQQAADGSFSGTGTTAAPNANSTGLAAQALRAGGATAAADRAATWLLGLQSGCGAAAGQRGAVAYDASGFDPGNAVRATAQAVLGLSGVGFGALTLSGAAPDAAVLACAAPTTPPATTPPATSPPASPPATPPATTPAAPTATAVPPRPAPAGPVTPAPTAAAPGGELANTGADPAVLVWLGGGLVLVGAATAVAARRRTS
jgi:hypothetical protein